MRFAGTWKQYSKKAISQLTTNDFEERHVAVFEVAVPGEGHEDVGDGQQGDRPHGQ